MALPSDAAQATAIFKHNCSLVLAGLSAEQVIEAGQLGLKLNEYAHVATLEMYGLQGGLKKLYGSPFLNADSL